jgi:hypothetical protein
MKFAEYDRGAQQIARPAVLEPGDREPAANDRLTPPD